MSRVAIQIEGLTRDFGRRRALDDLSLEIPAGTTFGFLGPNGAGKTTTIRLLLGLLRPSAGEATVLGYNTRTEADEIRRRTGVLLEDSGLYELHTARENLELFARINGLGPRSRQARIEELLQHFGLWERRNERVGRWSRGMKQRLAIARALLNRPPLIFLDEPTAGLDPAAAAQLRRQILELGEDEETTIFLTTHNLAEAEELCSQIAIINQGKRIAHGSPDGLRTDTKTRKLEVVAQNISSAVIESLTRCPEVEGVSHSPTKIEIALTEGARIPPIITLLVELGLEIEEVRRKRNSLEEVYLSLMEIEA